MRTWEDCAQFHGHKCPGLAIGYRAAVLAMEKLGLSDYIAAYQETYDESNK